MINALPGTCLPAAQRLPGTAVGLASGSAAMVSFQRLRKANMATTPGISVISLSLQLLQLGKHVVGHHALRHFAFT